VGDLAVGGIPEMLAAAEEVGGRSGGGFRGSGRERGGGGVE
jgi:hypothetical protein